MTGHARNEARSAGAGGPLRRAWIAAWTVATTMAATTMGFQVYHALKWGHEPWGVAYPVGIVPLLISLCILEIVAEWRDAPGWAKAGAYAIMGGSMFLSASATGKVVLASSPPHMSLLFGFLLDGAALLAVHFILNGPRKADEVAAAEAERRAALERAENDARASLRRELDAVTARAGEEITALRQAVSEAEADRETARSEAEALTARVESLTRKLAGSDGRKPTGNGTRKGAGSTARKAAGSRAASAPEAHQDSGAEVPADLDSEALVLRYLSEGKSASEAGRLAGLSDARGRQIARKLAKTAPQDVASGDPGD